MITPLSSVAFSKINLFLKVTKRRSDGYHELETIFLPIPKVADTITITKNEVSKITLSCSLPTIPCDKRNIAWKAAEAYAQATGIVPDWHIDIIKKIPSSAGMGGGSSDAATVLTLLNDFYKALSKNELAKIALSLGADVPFFLQPQLAVATGIGEDITLLAPPKVTPPMVIVNPQFPVSAKWAYQHLDIQRIGEQAGGKDAMLDSLQKQDWQQLAEKLHNDLEFALYDKFPMLQLLKKELIKAGSFKPLVTGSGSTIYAICESNELAKLVAEKISSKFPNCLVFVT